MAENTTVVRFERKVIVMIYTETPVDGTPGWSVCEYREGPCALTVTRDENGPMTYSFHHDNPLGPKAIIDPTPGQPESLYVCVSFTNVAAEVDKLDGVHQMVDDVQRFFKSLEESGAFKIERKSENKKEGNALQYEVTFSRFGTAIVEAESRDEAMEIANKMNSGEVAWDDDITPTDIQEI